MGLAALSVVRYSGARDPGSNVSPVTLQLDLVGYVI